MAPSYPKCQRVVTFPELVTGAGFSKLRSPMQYTVVTSDSLKKQMRGDSKSSWGAQMWNYLTGWMNFRSDADAANNTAVSFYLIKKIINLSSRL